MNDRQRERLKTVVTGLSLLWVAVAGWDQFADIPPEEIQTHHSLAVQEKLKAQCDDKSRDRFDCKETIVIETHRATFYNLSERLLVVVVPPMLAAIAFAVATRRRPDEYEPHSFTAPDHSRHGRASAAPADPHRYRRPQPHRRRETVPDEELL